VRLHSGNSAPRGTCAICHREDMAMAAAHTCGRCYGIKHDYDLTDEEVMAAITDPRYNPKFGGKRTPISEIVGKFPVAAKRYAKELSAKGVRKGPDSLNPQAPPIVFKEPAAAFTPSQLGSILAPSGIQTTGFPKKKMIPVWETSDGKEHGVERDALLWELDILRGKLRRR
jgi:hypothetical protein